MNRRGFLGALAALAVAPKTLALPAAASPPGIGRFLAPSGLQGWLPREWLGAYVVADWFCPPDNIYMIGSETTWKLDGNHVEFFGVDRGRPCLIAHPKHVDELRSALDDALARLGRDVERDTFAVV